MTSIHKEYKVDEERLINFATKLVGERSQAGRSVVPDRCVATFDRRTLPGETEDDVLLPVQQIVKGVLENGEAEGRAAIAEDDFDSPELTHCTNGSDTAGTLGIPTVGFGPGNEELAHRVDEYIQVDQLTTATRGYAAIAEQLTGMED